MADLEQNVAETKGKLGDRVDEFKQKAQEKAKDLLEEFKDKAQEKAKDLKEGLSREVTLLKRKNFESITQDAREYIVDNPGKSVAFALLAGFFIGVLIKRH